MMTELKQGIFLDSIKVEKYLQEAEKSALKSLAANKWSLFGYWAAQSVHLRRILGLSNKPSPFRCFSDLAKKQLKEMEDE